MGVGKCSTDKFTFIQSYSHNPTITPLQKYTSTEQRHTQGQTLNIFLHTSYITFPPGSRGQPSLGGTGSGIPGSQRMDKTLKSEDETERPMPAPLLLRFSVQHVGLLCIENQGENSCAPTHTRTSSTLNP